MPAVELTTIQTLHGALVLATVPTYFAYFYKFDGTTGDLTQVDSMLAALALEIHTELKDRISPLFSQDANKSIILSDKGKSYKEEPGNVVESEAFKESIRAFASSHSSYLFKYGRVLALREALVFWRRNLAWCVLAILIWELTALVAVFVLPRLWPLHTDDIQNLSVVPLAILIVFAFFSLLLIRIKNDCLATIRTGLTALPS